MSILADFDISGEGKYVFSSFTPVESLIVRMTALGTVTSRYDLTAPYRVARLGYMAMGAEFDPGDGTVTEFWTRPLWLDFEFVILFPPGRPNEASGVGNYFDRVRWAIPSPGAGHVWINVF